MLLPPGLHLGLMTAAPEPPQPRAMTTAQGSRVVHSDPHVPGAAVVFVDESGDADAWTAQVEAVVRAGLCAVLLVRDPEDSEDSEDSEERTRAQVCADDLADLMQRLEHDTTTLVGRDHGAAGVVRFLADHADARVGHAVLLGLVLPAPDSVEDGGVEGSDTLVAELRRIHIPVFVAHSADELLSVDDLATELQSWLPDRFTVRAYPRRRSFQTPARRDEFLDDLLDFIGRSDPVHPPRVDLASAPTSTRNDTRQEQSS